VPPSRTVAFTVGWVAGVAAAAVRWPHGVEPILATGAVSATVALSLAELARIWWPRR
jgi:hypothetical protein